MKHQFHVEFRASGFVRGVGVDEERNGVKAMLHNAKRHRSHAAIFAGFNAGLTGPGREFNVNWCERYANAEVGHSGANRVCAAFFQESIAEKATVPKGIFK